MAGAYLNLREYADGTCVDERGMGPAVGAPLFACHMAGVDPGRVCAGWLVVEGPNHPTIRLAVIVGVLAVEDLQPGENWPPLYASAVEMFEVQACHARMQPPTPER
ncbi:hypothetical protein JOL79_07030 [Microbispora sp. RL4-1S]|uniref:Uncharacterized protein n=1 Tax=Microbispora oryzae TaxID=2806554 RepID=A0A940WHZ2_9ACTN|nr:hypothetical protein [Microbispora oryzae]